MTFIEWLISISPQGIGTELGILNVIALTVIGWLVKRETTRVRANVAPVYKRDIGELVERLDELWESRESEEEKAKRAALDTKLLEMWKEHEYQKRRDQSDQLNLDPKAIQEEVANQIARLLAKEGK